MIYPKVQILPWSVALALQALSASLAAQTAAPAIVSLPEVKVSAERPLLPQSAQNVDLSTGRSSGVRDSSALIESVPGASVVRNGSQTGIVQLRGLFGDRVNVKVDGMHITPACPNHMDPPLHYISAHNLESIEVIAGITPVSMGGDSIAGSVSARSAAPRFGAGQGLEVSGKLAGGVNGSNQGYNALLQASAANAQFSIGYTGETQHGDNLKFPGGSVRATGYELTRHDLTLASQTPGGLWRLDVGRHESFDAGTPALPMDMIKDNADKYALSYLGDVSFGTLEARLYRHAIDHLMDNYHLRGLAAGMLAPATSEDTGFKLSLSIPDAASTWRVGLEYLSNDFDVYSQSSSMAAASIKDNIRAASRDRIGLFGERETRLSPQWKTLIGLRSDSVSSDAAAVTHLGLMGLTAAQIAMTRADAARFNAAQRDLTDHNWDLAGQAVFNASPSADYEFGLARKTRSPNLMERYVWSPNNATAGLADGRTYLGNLTLKPEISNQLNLAANWHGAVWQVKPGLFYNRVQDYIQGVATTRLDAVGKAVLQFGNVEAELYGVDMHWQYQAASELVLSGIFSYVRGKNLNTQDNLYRIAPLKASFNADYTTGHWSHRAEWQLAAEQNKVSVYNGESATAGYGIVNLRTRYQAQKNLGLSFGIENLLDKAYADHLGGINRVAGGDVAVGQHLPGAGRFAYLSLDYGF